MNNSKWILLGRLIIMALLLGGCQPELNITTQAELEQSFQEILDTVVAKNKNVHNAVVMVQGPDFVWKGAAGMADPDAGLEMLPDDQFRSASSAKMMLATLMMKLTETGNVDLDVPITDYLSTEVMDGLHIYEGQDYSGIITTRHLLQHTSGLADNWTNETGEFMELVLEGEPDKFWEPDETILWAKENLPPLFAPGESFHYSDINYMLAGLVIESVTGQPLHEVYREQLFGPLGMEHTYMEFHEEPRPSLPGRTLSHVSFEDIDYTNHRALSADWAGGGLVTTTEDMNIFMQAFVNDEIFANPETRAAMLDWIDWEGDDTLDYGLGVMRIQGKTLMVWGHLGVGQVLMYYWPDGDVILTGTLNQQDANGGAIISQILKAVRSYQENQ